MTPSNMVAARIDKRDAKRLLGSGLLTELLRSHQRLLAFVVVTVMFCVLWFSFLVNGFGVAPWSEWSVWERGSNAMVMKRIEADLVGRDTPGLGLAQYQGNEFTVFERLSTEKIRDLATTAPTSFVPYESELGGQARLMSFAWRQLGCSSEGCLHALTSGLFAALCIALFLGLGVIGSQGLAWAWFFSTLCSPWMTFIARNYFWSPWFYLLPAVAGIGLVLAKTRLWRIAAGVCVFAAFLIKYWATGYHEVTVFVMLAASMPLIAIAFRSASMRSIRHQLWNTFTILALASIAFAIVICVHAYVLAGSVTAGLNQIWVNTVLRRTYGSAVDYGPLNEAGLNAHPLAVLWKYVWTDWWTNLTRDLLAFSLDKGGSFLSIRLGPAAFLLMTIACVVVVVTRLIRRDETWIRDCMLLTVGFSTAAVWFVAAKGYAFQHPFLLFFNWYFLFVPVILFVLGSFIWGSRGTVGRWVQAVSLSLESLQTRGHSAADHASTPQGASLTTAEGVAVSQG